MMSSKGQVATGRFLKCEGSIIHLAVWAEATARSLSAVDTATWRRD